MNNLHCKPCTLITIFALIATVGSYFAGCGVNSKPGLGSNTTQSKYEGQPQSGTGIGQFAPDFNISTLDGSSISLEKLKGKPVMLVFWTAWCPSCKEEAPKVNRIHNQFSDSGLQVIGINIGESDARIREGIRDFGIQYIVAKDPATSVSKSYNVVGTPTVVILDKQGKVQYFGNEVPRNPEEVIKPLLES
jgi:peroxiredoxin